MRFLGMTEEFDACDCCGKAPLKVTVAFETEDGEIVHYGTTCAARNTGRKVSEWQSDERKDAERRAKLARVRYEHHDARIAYVCKLAEARRLGLIGRPSADFVRVYSDAARAARNAIAAEFHVETHTLGL